MEERRNLTILTVACGTLPVKVGGLFMIDTFAERKMIFIFYNLKNTKCKNMFYNNKSLSIIKPTLYKGILLVPNITKKQLSLKMTTMEGQ